MNIQIFGKAKCFDTKKAERYFKERGIKYQYIDLQKKGMSRGEFQSIRTAVGLQSLIDEKASGSEILKYLAHQSDVEDKLFENQSFLKTPIVRNGKKATVAFAPDVWASWE